MDARPDPVDARLTELLRAWQADITAVPIPSLVDPIRAVDVIDEARRGRRRVHAPPDGACTRRRDQESAD
ncbi:MAG TPA: hypothetical protein VJX66_21845 [Amycolatopsis sp.]|nr:hypothetical protein [Amycolatopsis sp.]